jgi:hypothetical protein
VTNGQPWFAIRRKHFQLSDFSDTLSMIETHHSLAWNSLRKFFDKNRL